MANKQSQRTSPERIAVDQRAAKCLELRQSGKSLRAIASEVDMTASGVLRAIERELAALTREPAERLRELELERLDVLFAGHWPRAIRGDVARTDRCLRIMERRARLLGLDAPTKNVHTGEGGEPIALTVASAEAEVAKALEIHHARLASEPAYRKRVMGE